MNDHNSQWINDTCMMFKNTLKDIDTGTVRNILTLALMDCEKMVKHLYLNQKKMLANTLESQNVQWHRAIGEEQSAKDTP